MDAKRIAKLFPYLANESKINNLKIDEESIHFISVRDAANLISKIICKHLQSLKIKDAIITDATAGVGGNTLSFSHYFSCVNAIEIDSTRCDYLKSNLELYNITNTITYNEDCTKILDTIGKHNVVFIDPPWGGSSYKKEKTIRCKISSIPIEILCNDIMNGEKTKHIPELVVFKLPKNYDLNYFNKYINSNKIYIHNLKKMLLIVVFNSKFDHVNQESPID